MSTLYLQISGLNILQLSQIIVYIGNEIFWGTKGKVFSKGYSK